MERSNIIMKVLIFSAIGLIIKLGAQASKKQAIKNHNQDIILMMPNFYSIIGRIGLVAGFGLGIFGLIEGNINSEDIYYAIGIILLFLVMGTLLILVANNTIIVNDNEIKNQNPLGKEQTIIRSNINKVTFGKISQTLHIYDQNKNIGLHRHLIGFDEFMKKLIQKLDKKLYEDAIKNYKKVKNQTQW